MEEGEGAKIKFLASQEAEPLSWLRPLSLVRCGINTHALIAPAVDRASLGESPIHAADSGRLKTRLHLSQRIAQIA